MSTPSKKPSKAAIYARISLDSEGEGKGVKRQVDDCRRRADELGWTVVGEYVDNDASAYSGKRRPEYERLLADIGAGALDGVLVYNLDRLTRRMIEFEQFAVIATKAGVPLLPVTGEVDIGTEDGLLMGRIQAAFAAKESAAKSRRQKRKNDEKAAAGIPHGGYRRPFGFEADKITQVPSEVRAIRNMVDQFLAGRSYIGIARWLNQTGVRTVGGSEWSSTSVRGIILSARIAGLRQHRREIVGPSIWKPVINAEKRTLVLAEADRRKVTNRRPSRRHLLSGLLRCGRCSNKLYTATRVTTRRYVCSSSVDHGGCGGITVVATPLDELIADAVLVRLDTPALANALAGRQIGSDDLSALNADREADHARLQEAAAFYADRQITTPEWIEIRNRIEARLKQTDRRLRRASPNPALSDLLGRGDSLRKEWANLELEDQSVIVSAVLDHAVIGPGTRGVRALDPGRVTLKWRL